MFFKSQFIFRTLLMAIVFFASTSRAENFRVMLHTGSFPPYFFQEGNPQTGTIRDIFTAITQETGDSVEYVRVPFKRALRQFENGDIDIEPMSNPAWRKDSTVPGVYSLPFTTAESVVLFRQGKQVVVHSPEDLLGKTIGIIQGYSYPEYDAYFIDKRIKSNPLNNENKLIQLLLAEHLNQVLISKDFALYQIKHQQLEEQLVIGDTYSRLDMMIRFHPAKQSAIPRFNKAIKKLLKNGTIDEIYDRYR